MIRHRRLWGVVVDHRRMVPIEIRMKAAVHLEDGKMVRPVIAGNWKMNKTVAEAVDFVTRLVKALNPRPEPEVIIAPPFTALQAVAALLQGSPVRLAAQNLHEAEKGAY